MEDSWSPAKPSELRFACEECHKRKIRCEVPRDGSRDICEACQVNQRQCLFSLKVKTGRPRKADPDPKKDAGDRAHSSHNSSASPNGSTPDGIIFSPYQQPAGPTQDVSSRQTSSYGPPANQHAGHYIAARSKRGQTRLPISPLAVQREKVPSGFRNLDQGAELTVPEISQSSISTLAVKIVTTSSLLTARFKGNGEVAKAAEVAKVAEVIVVADIAPTAEITEVSETAKVTEIAQVVVTEVAT